MFKHLEKKHTVKVINFNTMTIFYIKWVRWSAGSSRPVSSFLILLPSTPPQVDYLVAMVLTPLNWKNKNKNTMMFLFLMVCLTNSVLLFSHIHIHSPNTAHKISALFTNNFGQKKKLSSFDTSNNMIGLTVNNLIISSKQLGRNVVALGDFQGGV